MKLHDDDFFVDVQCFFAVNNSEHPRLCEQCEISRCLSGSKSELPNRDQKYPPQDGTGNKKSVLCTRHIPPKNQETAFKRPSGEPLALLSYLTKRNFRKPSYHFRETVKLGNKSMF